MHMANWSELPFDMLEHLTSLLPIQDYHRFSAVCQNWRMVAKQKCYSPTKQIPWLALGETEDKKKRKFYNLSEDKHHYLDVPELRGKVLCGSSRGWLFTLDRKLNFHLVNPLTRECYDLPTPPPFREGEHLVFEQDVPRYLEAESEDEAAHGVLRRIFEEVQRVLVVKGIFDYDPSTRSDFTALILYGDDDTPAFWRPGDNAWTAITGVPSYFDDITFFEGKAYVVRHLISNNYIDGHAIFLGGSSPVIISHSQFPNCMKDAIYFTDLECGHKKLYGAEDLGIYDMIGKSITPYYPREVFHHPLAAPIWFTPNPW